MFKTKSGFTLVELLIVIVVIAILAAITVVAYNGITNRANDTAVQSDLRNFASKIMQYQAINGSYPAGATTAAPGGVTFSVSRGSYDTSKHNFVYCTNGTADQFIITGASKSGNRFSYSSDGGLQPYTQNWGAVAIVCTNAGYASYTFSYGYNSNGTWWSWTQ